MIFKFCHYHIIQLMKELFYYFASEENPIKIIKLNFFLTLFLNFLEKVITVFNGLSKDEMKDNETIQQVLDENKQTYGLNYEFQHYVCLCGLFSPKRNIVKNWKHNQTIFVDLVKAEGKIGVDHFL